MLSVLPKVGLFAGSGHSRANKMLSFKCQDGDAADMSVYRDDQRGYIEQIRIWLVETANISVVVQGLRRKLYWTKLYRVDEIVDYKPIQEP